MAKVFHPSVEGAQHGPKGLEGFLDFAKKSGAEGAQISNFMLEAKGGGFRPAKEIKAEFEKADKALRIFGSTYAPMTSEKVEALEEAVEFYEKLMDYIAKKNPKILKELGII